MGLQMVVVVFVWELDLQVQIQLPMAITTTTGPFTTRDIIPSFTLVLLVIKNIDILLIKNYQF
jgi:hypothetical protein